MWLFIVSSLMLIQRNDFYQGEWKGNAISNEGISLTYDYKKIGEDIGEVITDLYKWGESIYVGTNQGNIYRIYRCKRELIYNSGGNYVVFGGNKKLLLAGISPQGKLFSIKGKNVAPYINLDVDYIWCINTGKYGEFYIGTGADGKIYRLKNGVKEIYFKTDAKNITSQLFFNKKLYATTSYPGLIYEIQGKNNGYVYFDPMLDEVMGIGFSHDTMYLAGNNGEGENINGLISMVNDGIDTLYSGGIILSAGIWDKKYIAGEAKDGEI